MYTIKVISLGGSMIVPEKVDTDFLKQFHSLIVNYINEDNARKVILVCGGGGTAREYQKAFKYITGKTEQASEDWIGIAATKLNAEFLKHIFAGYCLENVIDNPEDVPGFRGRILIASGWKPGFSTDYDAVLLANKYSAGEVINLSNISKVYSKDPKTHPDAESFDHITWDKYIGIVGVDWIPGMNLPFDPVAAQKAAELELRVIIASGKNNENTRKILYDEPFEGTVIE